MQYEAQTTILIPNYNGIKFIEECLTSIRNMNESYPVIVVDNGSCDGSDEIIADRFPEVQLIRLLENTGFCHAVNVGLNEVATPYVFLLNNDTTVEPDTIEMLERCIKTNDRIFSVQSLILNMYNHELIDDAGDTYSALGWARGIHRRPSEASAVFSCCGAAVLYRMSAFDEIGLFDENHFAYLEDVDLGYRARINGYINMCEPASITYHAGSATSGSKHNKFKVDLSSRNSIYLIYKNMPIFQLICNLPFLLIGFVIKTAFFIIKGMGINYVRGLFRGFKMCSLDRRNGHRHKVWFKPSNAIRYLVIQLELWKNIFAL